MLKKPWICPACRSIASTRLAPAVVMQVGHELGGDRHARLRLPVLPGVAVVRHHGRDAAGRRALERVDHDQQLHQVVVHRRAGRLDDEDVLAAHVLVDLDVDLAVARSGRRRHRPASRAGAGRSPRRAGGSRCRRRASAHTAWRSPSFPLPPEDVAGAGGIEPPLRGPKPRVLPLDDAPRQPCRVPVARALIARGWRARRGFSRPSRPSPPDSRGGGSAARGRASAPCPNTVGPLPDISAPSAPAASSAALIRPTTGRTGSTMPSRVFVSAAATRTALRMRRASTTRAVPVGCARQPAGTRSYTSRVERRHARIHEHERIPPGLSERLQRCSPRPVASAGPTRQEERHVHARSPPPAPQDARAASAASRVD